MTTDYNPIAKEYKESKLQPWRTYIESYTLMGLAGDLRGKAVVDVACGEGYYTRLLRTRGAAQVTGVDLSEGMIALAQQQEAANPLGIEYVVGDGRTLQLPVQYDLAVAAYLLNYAPNRAELLAMCRGIANCLKPGGRFVTVNSSPALDFPTAPSYRPYGFETTISKPFGEGSPIRWRFYVHDKAIDLENYFLDVAIHEEAFRAAGFREVRWHPARLAPEGEAAHGAEFWRTFLEHPPVAFIECVK